jgi:phage terminase large subunit GpA-like protein
MTPEQLDRASDLIAAWSAIIAPPPKWTISEWADHRRKLSGEAAAEKGQWRTNRAEYQRGIMDAVADPTIEQVVVMSSAQVGKTEILLNCIGYFVDFDPSPLMLVQPDEAMAETFSKDRLAPMFRDSPSLRSKVRPAKTRDSGNTILHKRFPGGHVTLVGANAPSGLASRPIRILLLDEVDRYPASAGTEGDPVNLAIARTKNFWNRRVVMVSTPTVKGLSRIERSYELSDQRHFVVPCPHCQHPHPLRWGNVVWPEGRRDLATLRCPACNGTITSAQKNQAVAKCAPLPDGTKPIGNDGQPLGWRGRAPFTRIAGFHLNELYSPWRSIADIAIEHGRAKDDPSTLQVWINTSLGETWEEGGERISEHALIERCEPYPQADVPARGLILTAGVDTQQDRLEIEVVAWAGGEESWSVAYHVILGDPDIPEGTAGSPWTHLTDYLRKRWTSEAGGEMVIETTCIDTGGSNTQAVYGYVKRHKGDRVYGVKGQGGPGLPIVGNPARRRAGKKTTRPIDVYIVGVDNAKSIVYKRLRITEPGSGYCHFPQGRSAEYFRGLTAEKAVTKFVKGFPRLEWHKTSGARNEPLDCRVYAFAALVLRAPQFDKLALRRRQTMPAPKPAEVETPPPVERPAEDTPRPDHNNAAKRKRTTRRASFVHSW